MDFIKPRKTPVPAYLKEHMPDKEKAPGEILQRRFKGPVHNNDIERIDQMIIKVHESLKNKRPKSSTKIGRSILLDKLKMNTQYAKMFGCDRELVNKMTDDPKSKSDTAHYTVHLD